MSELTIESPAVARINECHQRFLELGSRNASGLVEQINTARETGLLLIGEREKCKHGQWLPKFKSANGQTGNDYQFDFSYETAKNHMRVAKLITEPITELPQGVRVLTDVFRMSNALPQPEPSARQNASGDYYQDTAKKLAGIIVTVDKWKSATPLSEWPQGQREELKTTLKPLVEMFRELGGELAQG